MLELHAKHWLTQSLTKSHKQLRSATIITPRRLDRSYSSLYCDTFITIETRSFCTDTTDIRRKSATQKRDETLLVQTISRVMLDVKTKNAVDDTRLTRDPSNRKSESVKEKAWYYNNNNGNDSIYYRPFSPQKSATMQLETWTMYMHFALNCFHSNSVIFYAQTPIVPFVVDLLYNKSTTIHSIKSQNKWSLTLTNKQPINHVTSLHRLQGFQNDLERSLKVKHFR